MALLALVHVEENLGSLLQAAAMPIQTEGHLRADVLMDLMGDSRST